MKEFLNQKKTIREIKPFSKSIMSASIILLSYFVSMSSPALGGGRDSAGGSGVAYYKTEAGALLSISQEIEKVITTDVYRAQYEFPFSEGIHLDQEYLDYKVSAQDITVETKSNQILNNILIRLSKKSPVFVEELIKAKKFVEAWTPILDGTHLKLNPDFGPQLNFPDPKHTAMVQIIERRADQFFKDEFLYKKMDALNRAAIKFHEMAYAVASHLNSYNVQLLFAHVVSSEFNNMTNIEFEDLMSKKLNLKYQNQKTTPEQLSLPQGAKIVQDSSEDNLESFENFNRINSKYGFGNYYTNVNASTDATCGEIVDYDKDKMELKFRHMSKNNNPFESKNFDEGIDYISVSEEQWKIFSETSINIKNYLKAIYPEYLYPTTFLALPFRACLELTFNDNLERFDYIEFRFGYSSQERTKVEGRARLATAEFKINTLKDELKKIKKEYSEIENDYNNIHSLTPQHRQKKEIIFNRKMVPLSVKMAEIKAKLAALEFANTEMNGTQNLSEINKSFNDFIDIRTFGIKFPNSN